MNSPSNLPLAGIFGLGGTELIVIFLIIVLLFGGAKLPGLAKGLGQSIKEFKKASKEDDAPEKPSETKTAATTSPKANDKN
jgi:sec-independent protein translocase protein TatA